MRRGSALTLAALLAGCTAGPDYHLPERAAVNAKAAQGKFDAANDKAFSSEALPDHWWRLYNDATLDGLIGEALAANTDLRAADANLRAATAVVLQAEAQRTVQTSVEGGVALARPYATGLPLPGQMTYDAARCRSTFPGASGARSRRRRPMRRRWRRCATRCA